MSTSDADSKESYECPTCGDDFSSEHGLKVHHKTKHGESLAGFSHKCDECGDTFDSDWNRRKQSENVFCSRECQNTFRSKELSGKNHPNWRERVERKCDECGTHFDVPPWRSEKARFCSSECAGSRGAELVNERQRVTLTCEQCGSEYEEIPSRAERSRFCSVACKAKNRSFVTGEDHPCYKRVNVDCRRCGVEFEIRPSRRGVIVYCSDQCRSLDVSERFSGEGNPMYSGGAFPYGDGWTESKKRQVRKRDQARCQHCGRAEPEHIKKYGTKHAVHHIEKARSVDDDEKRNHPDNLITLCRGGCHHTWEQMSPLRPQMVSD